MYIEDLFINLQVYVYNSVHSRQKLWEEIGFY